MTELDLLVPQVTFDLYRIPGLNPNHPSGMQLYASSVVRDFDPRMNYEVSGWEPWAGMSNTYYRLRLSPYPEVELFPGWFNLRAQLNIDQQIVHDWKPVLFFAGEVTDMASSLTRFREVHPTQDPHGQPIPPAVWALTVRRSA